MIETLRITRPNILVAGNHPGIMQSILDFDYASGRETSSIVGIVSSGRKSIKLFWGDKEILVPVFTAMESAKAAGLRADFLLNITSASSTPRMVDAFFAAYPDATGTHLFAENITERDALSLIERYPDKWFAGASGVGLLVPGILKLGAIGGIKGAQLARYGRIKGHTAIICSSGGMVNELIYQVSEAGGGVSFAVSYGGDRFPVTSPLSWLLEAEADPETKDIVFFGELGGSDEYMIRDAIKDGRITKPVFAYIAGRYESKKTAIQFGHAKALAKSEEETARAKTEALRAVGVSALDSFSDFLTSFIMLDKGTTQSDSARDWSERPSALRRTHFSAPVLPHTENTGSFTEAILYRLLRRAHISKELIAFADLIFRELLDHGPQVSGAVNTMVTTRAGRDMMSSLATGILTIGDRFGGAINNAAAMWHESVRSGKTAESVVQGSSKSREHIPGIGHLKYSIYRPDPRVEALIAHAEADLKERKHLTFAKEVAAFTSKKKQNLILNVDGAMAAIFLDYLYEYEKFSPESVRELTDIGFFNALFVIPRSVGFTGNHFDQKRIDEGLFRLGDHDIFMF